MRISQIVEQAKSYHPALCLEAFQHLFRLEDSGAQLNGLALLRHVVANSWNKLAKEQHQAVVQLVHSAVTSSEFVSMAAPVKTQLAYAMSEVAIRGGMEVIQHTLTSVVVQIIQKGVLLCFFMAIDLYRGESCDLSRSICASSFLFYLCRHKILGEQQQLRCHCAS